VWERPVDRNGRPDSRPLYTQEERRRRDQSPWTLVQGVLAPIQFLICLASAALILRYLATGEGYVLATASIILKTVALLAIMVTGSIWEKEVFGVWLFAPAFFWEDVVSFLVIGLHAAYVAALATGTLSPSAQMGVALAAYAAYAVNATQFLLKLRAARLGARTAHDGQHGATRPYAGVAS
jgi:3-vinyl bacteriochlorophyllide hydratase